MSHLRSVQKLSSGTGCDELPAATLGECCASREPTRPSRASVSTRRKSQTRPASALPTRGKSAALPARVSSAGVRRSPLQQRVRESAWVRWCDVTAGAQVECTRAVAPPDVCSTPRLEFTGCASAAQVRAPHPGGDDSFASPRQPPSLLQHRTIPTLW